MSQESLKELALVMTLVFALAWATVLTRNCNMLAPTTVLKRGCNAKPHAAHK